MMDERKLVVRDFLFREDEVKNSTRWCKFCPFLLISRLDRDPDGEETSNRSKIKFHLSLFSKSYVSRVISISLSNLFFIPCWTDRWKFDQIITVR